MKKKVLVEELEEEVGDFLQRFGVSSLQMGKTTYHFKRKDKKKKCKDKENGI